MFLLLVVPAIAFGFVVIGSNQGFVITAIATMLRDLGLGALVLFFAWSAGDGVTAIGWRAQHIGREILLGIALYAPMLLLVTVAGELLRAAGLHAVAASGGVVPQGDGQISLAAVLVVVVACAEETIFRGYLLLRLRAATGSTTAAVALSTALFAAGHAYEGVIGVVLVAILGVFLALVYLWRRSLVAPIVMHFLQDFLGLVVIPLLAAH